MIRKSLLLLVVMVAPLSAMKASLFQEMGAHLCYPRSNSFRILSIVGGPTKGSVPLETLSIFEKKTFKSISSSFNLIAGSSFGGVIALALTTPYLLDSIYPKYGATYLKNYFFRPTSDLLTKNRGSVYGFFKPIYDRTKFENAIDTLLGVTPLSQTTSGCMVTAVDAKTFAPCSFYKFPEKDIFQKTQEDYTRKDLAMAVSAMPIYFKPQFLTSLDKKKRFLTIDGGDSVDDLTLDALTVVLQLLKNHKKKIPIEIVTLTCGYKVESDKSLERIQKMGLLGWSYRFGDTFLGPNKKEKKEFFDVLDIKNTYLNVAIPEEDFVSTDSTLEQEQKIVQLTQNYLNNSSEFYHLIEEYRETRKMDLDFIVNNK